METDEGEHSMTTEHRGGPVIETVVQVALLALLAYACAHILSPFANLLLWALILAVTLNPLNRRLAGATGGRRGRAATLLVLAILALVGTPTVLLTVSLAGDVVSGYRAFEAGTLAVPPPQDVVAEEFEGSIELVSRALDLFHFPTGAIAKFSEALRDEGYGAIRSGIASPIDPWLMELLDQVDDEWVDVPEGFAGEASLAELGIRARTGATILAVERAGTTVTNPPSSQMLRAGDRLLVLADAAAIAALRELLASRSD